MKTKILKHGLYHLFSTLPLLSLLGGCVANSPQKEITEPIPEWFMNTPNDTGNFYFGVGEGRSKDVAKNVALNDIASRISVTVKSTLSSEINQKIAKGKELITRNSQQKLLAQVKAIEFSNYNIDKMIVQNNRNYVLVKVNRIALYKKRLKKLNVKMNVTQIMDLLHKKCYTKLARTAVHIVDKYPGCSVGNIMETKAESKYYEVAAASIIARYFGLMQIRTLEMKAGFFIPFGSSNVESALLEIRKKSLDPSKLVKMKFRNVIRFFE